MSRRPAISGRIGEWLLRWRWQLAGFISVTSVVIELAENQPNLLYHIDLLVFMVVVPSFVGVVLSGVARAQSRMVQDRKDAIEAERRHVARDLHDSLGQQLGYLHLKLEQLTADDAETDIVVIRQEMQRMRSVVQESYSLVRTTLLALDAPLPTDLVTALQDLAGRATARGGFALSFATRGRRSSLSPYVQNHLLYIVREALSNIEKHAKAESAAINLTWTRDNLSIHIHDNGVGFEPGDVSLTDHLGLKIMQERADEIGARLEITSHRGEGTELVLFLPLDGFVGSMPAGVHRERTIRKIAA